MANMFEDIVEEELARQDQQAAAPPPHAGATAENMFQDIIDEELQARGELADPSQSDQLRDSFLDSVGQGLSMGFGDEIAGAAAGAYNAVRGRGFQEGYEGTRDALRSNYGAYKERQPYWSMAGEIAGGVAPSFVPGLNVARAGSLGAAALRGAGAGALGGAVYGYGQGEDGIANRAGNAAMGAAVGGTIGGALPAATVGIKRGAQTIKDVVRPNAASRAGINRPAQREISRTLDADDMTMQDVADRLREYGNDAAIIDASDGLRETGRQMVQFGSPGSAPLAKLGKERGRQVASRVNNAFEEVLGQRPSPAELVEALKKRTQRNAGQNFGAARTANAGRPVSTQGIVDDLVTDTGSLDAADVLARRDLSLPEDRMRQEFTRRLTRDRADEATETIRNDLQSYRPDAPRPESLGSFLRRKGFDPATRDRGDLDAIIGSSAGRARGLLRSGGYRDLDDAAEAAHEAALSASGRLVPSSMRSTTICAATRFIRLPMKISGWHGASSTTA